LIDYRPCLLIDGDQCAILTTFSVERNPLKEMNDQNLLPANNLQQCIYQSIIHTITTNVQRTIIALRQ